MRNGSGWLAGTTPAALAACMLACTGDDTTPLAPDDGGAPDATLADAGTDAADATADVAEASAPLCAPYDASAFTSAQIEAGLQIVVAQKCEQCHGAQLQGKPLGMPSADVDGGFAYPPDLTPDPVTGLGCWTDSQIVRAFLYGIDNEGQPICAPMPRFGDLGASGIDDAGALAVLAYLRTVPIVVDPVPAMPSCPAPSEDAGADAGEGDAGADAAADAGDAGDAGAADAGEGGGPSEDASADAPG